MRAELFAAALLIGCGAGLSDAQTTRLGGNPIEAAVVEAEQRFGVPKAWIRAVMRRESAGDVRATSPKGAMGLMQLMPDTWTTLRLRLGLGADPYDIHDNILAGAAYLRQLYDQFGPTGFLAAYNAGPGRYVDFLARGRPLPGETRAYVAAVAPLLDATAPPTARSATVAPPAPPPSVFVRLDDFASGPRALGRLFAIPTAK